MELLVRAVPDDQYASCVAVPEPVTPPPPPLTQVPLIAKHPPLILIPFEKVEVAERERLMKFAPVPIESEVPGVDEPIPKAGPPRDVPKV